MSAEPAMGAWVLAWALLALFVLVRNWRQGRSVGIVLTYVCSLTVLHWFAPVLHLLPWFELERGDMTAEGLRQSTFAIAGFAVGAELLRSWRRREPEPADHEGPDRATPVLINVYLGAGLLLYALGLSGAQLPITAIVATGSTLVAASVGLKCWSAWQARRPHHMAQWLIVCMMFPLITVVTQGFLGFGFVAVLIVGAFVASLIRLRVTTVTVALLLMYGGLSTYVTYMRDRSDIRQLVWGGGGVEERIAQLQNTLSTAEWFDPRDRDHLARVDTRLNQNHLVGSAVAFIRDGNIGFAEGSTLGDAIVAVVPRALWPDKPVVGGSGDLVATYTGMQFAYGTSVGVGQVLELYINFGTTGVVLGFMLIGALVALADREAARHLAQGDVASFALWYMPGLSLLQVGGSIAEVTGTAAASIVLVLAVRVVGRHVLAARSYAPDPQPDSSL